MLSGSEARCVGDGRVIGSVVVALVLVEVQRATPPRDSDSAASLWRETVRSVCGISFDVRAPLVETAYPSLSSRFGSRGGHHDDDEPAATDRPPSRRVTSDKPQNRGGEDKQPLLMLPLVVAAEWQTTPGFVLPTRTRHACSCGGVTNGPARRAGPCRRSSWHRAAPCARARASPAPRRA